ncbi:hypothetical protein SAMN05216326_105120 [Nitrosomonas marina]|uniref:Uncharacterized protein n=1 Tax=Nitrosomonas marina TaxID=917 RepID=A0A1H9ZZT9_9PROT|nr:hypothetical protein SAMN05216326_105120 [Nitrosomonas marina]
MIYSDVLEQLPTTHISGHKNPNEYKKNDKYRLIGSSILSGQIDLAVTVLVISHG